MTSSHQNNASDPVNLALNYGYGFLEGEVRNAVNSVGLELSIRFLHDSSDYQTKQSLVYDLKEPFRWLIDFSVFQAFGTGTLSLHDFYFTGDDYRYRFESDARQRFVNLIRERFNSGVAYKGRMLKWDTLIEQKINELSRFFVNKSPALDFVEPAPELERQNGYELRDKILALSSSQAQQFAIGKSTLHYLRTRAESQRPFRVYSKTSQRITSKNLRRVLRY